MWWSCWRKGARYPTVEAAVQAAEGWAAVYHCKRCDGWHLDTIKATK